MTIKPIHSLDDRYGADQHGTIYRLTKHCSDKPLRTPRPIKLLVNRKNRYLQFNTYIGGKQRLTYAHVVVAEAWHGPRPSGHELHHKDTNRANCAPDNLEYKTPEAHHQLHDRGCYTDEQIEAVLRLCTKEKAKAVAMRYGMHRHYVSELWRGATRRVRRNPRWLKIIAEYKQREFLSPKDVQFIRRSKWPTSRLAAKFKRSCPHICAVRNGTVWQSVK